jgi:hypothetical protein
MYEIIPNLYLGNYKDSENLEDIDVVVNCTKQLEFPKLGNQIAIRIKLLDIDDKIDNDLLFSTMPTLCKFIDKWLNE